jgi:hypothetical protein
VGRAAAAGLVVEVYWSGGIDSTALLVALLRTATPAQRAGGLLIRLDDDSIVEYPLFYKEHIERPGWWWSG